MTQQEKDKLNKQLCGLLGICWHVPRKEIFIKNDKMECGKCCQWLRIRPARDENELTGGYEFVNPDFTSEVGRVQLLKIMMAREGSARFIIRIYEFNDHNSGAIHFANDIIDDNGAFAMAARDFLKAMEGK